MASAVIAITFSPLALANTSTEAAPSSLSWKVATTSSPYGGWYAVDYANGLWVALGHAAYAAVSSDGNSWTEYPVPIGSWQAIAYGNGEYVALSSVVSSPEEMISANGVNWSSVFGPAGSWTGLVFAQGRFVAVGSLGQIVTSTNGQEWTQVWNHSKWDLTSVAYGDGHFVAVDAAVGSTLISANGIDWRLSPPLGSGLKWGAVAYGNGTFVAFDRSGAGEIATSVYGYVWALHDVNPNQEITDAAFGCGQFLAGGEPTGSGSNFLSSTNGATWTATTVPTDPTADWTSLAYGRHRFVAVDSVGDIAWANSPTPCGAIPTTPRQVSGNVAGGRVWTYMHPPALPGASPVNSYRVTVSNGTTTRECTASVYYQPNCVVSGLKNHEVYWVSAQAHNRFGFSALTDPEFVIPVPKGTFNAVPSELVVTQSSPVVVQVTGITANSQGIYPTTVVTVHFGTTLAHCRPNPFGECLVTISNPPVGVAPIFATYTGYGRSYTSPISHITITP